MSGSIIHAACNRTHSWCLGLLLLVLCWQTGGLRAQPSNQVSEQPKVAPPHEVHQTQTSRTYRDTGIGYLDAGDWDRAITNLNKAIRLNPQDAWAWQCRAIARENKNDFKGAIADFRAALRINPDYANAYVNCGRFFQFKLHDLRVAIADYTQAIRLEPTNVDTLINRAQAYLELPNYDLAFSDFTAAIKLQTNNADLLIARAQAYSDQHQYDQALSDYNTAVQLNPATAGPLFTRGIFQEEMTNYPAAELDFTKATQLNPADPNYWSALGDLHAKMTNYDGAIDDFTRSIQLDPTNAGYFFKRAGAEAAIAKSLAMPGDQAKKQPYLDRAMADLQKAGTLDPDQLIRIGRFECQLGKYEQGIADFTKFLQKYPTNYNGLCMRAFAYERAAVDHPQRGESAKQSTAMDNALADWNQLVALDPGHETPFICYRGDFYARNQQYPKALNEYNQAIELQPTNHGARLSLAMFLASCPDPSIRNGPQALAIVQKAGDPARSTSCEYLMTLAAAYAETGDFAQAVLYQKRAISALDIEGYGDAFRAEMQSRLELYKQGQPCHRFIGVLLFE